MDFNHPLADKDLHFVGEIYDVRLATLEEIQHGHAHGAGGHHH
jgi:FKBP-type peptidyl-prolyl cis-trans isomerase SlyD